MSGDDLAILLFFLSCVLAFGLEAMKAETALRRAVFGVIATTCLLTGIFWVQIKKTWPVFSNHAAVVATNPVSWFVLAMFILSIFAFHRPKNARQTQSARPVPPATTDMKDEPVGPRVYGGVSATDLLEMFKDKTTVQAQALIGSYTRKWIYVTGLVKEVQRYRDGEVSVALTEGNTFVAARFIGEGAEMAVHLTKETKISIVGRIMSVENNIVVLRECEFI
jgi:hypothetical protein